MRSAAPTPSRFAQVRTAANVSATHGMPYQLALALPAIRRACRGDDADEFGGAVTKLLLTNQVSLAT